MTEIQFDRCACEDPAEDELLLQFPNGDAVRVVACDRCGEAVEWDRFYERDVDDRLACELPVDVVLDDVCEDANGPVVGEQFAVELALEDR